jgi:hypothetical protein
MNTAQAQPVLLDRVSGNTVSGKSLCRENGQALEGAGVTLCNQAEASEAQVSANQ